MMRPDATAWLLPVKGPSDVLHRATVVRQPGDGSCLFRSLAYGLRDGSTASSLRRQIASFVASNEELVIADSPLKDWIEWDSGMSVPQYCQWMIDEKAWGGVLRWWGPPTSRGPRRLRVTRWLKRRSNRTETEISL